MGDDHCCCPPQHRPTPPTQATSCAYSIDTGEFRWAANAGHAVPGDGNTVLVGNRTEELRDASSDLLLPSGPYYRRVRPSGAINRIGSMPYNRGVWQFYMNGISYGLRTTGTGGLSGVHERFEIRSDAGLVNRVEYPLATFGRRGMCDADDVYLASVGVGYVRLRDLSVLATSNSALENGAGEQKFVDWVYNGIGFDASVRTFSGVNKVLASPTLSSLGSPWPGSLHVDSDDNLYGFRGNNTFSPGFHRWSAPDYGPSTRIPLSQLSGEGFFVVSDRQLLNCSSTQCKLIDLDTMSVVWTRTFESSINYGNIHPQLFFENRLLLPRQCIDLATGANVWTRPQSPPMNVNTGAQAGNFRSWYINRSTRELVLNFGLRATSTIM